MAVDREVLVKAINRRLVRMERLSVTETLVAYKLAEIVVARHTPGELDYLPDESGSRRLCTSCGDRWPCTEINTVNDWLGGHA